ncbi:hypothetical protein SLE2022_125370 [Rubroshorea leprosula]
MSASSLSVAATAGASSPFCNNKLSPLFSLLLHPTTQFQSKPKWSLKPLRLKTQHSNPLPFSLNFSSSSRPSCFSSSFDSVQLAEEEESTEEEEEYPESEGFEESEQEEEEEQRAPQSGRDKGRLYVGNLPFSMTSSELTEIFGEAGRVVSAEIVYDRITDRSRGFAFVSMGSVEEAQEAIRLFDGSQIGGRTVKVNFPEVPRGGEREVMGPKIGRGYKGFVDSPYKIYAGNLGWGVTSQDLRDAFADQQGLLSAKVIYERGTGRSRGFGFVSFETAGDVEAAITAMNEVELEGRPLRLNVAAATRTPPAKVERKTENSLENSELFTSPTA